jgi:hypothetical protein
MLNPKPAQSGDRPSKVQRRVLCARYSECLEICLSKEWQGFSCSECSEFEFECPDDADHWVEQGKRSAWLLLSAGYLPRQIGDWVISQNEQQDLFLSP